MNVCVVFANCVRGKSSVQLLIIIALEKSWGEFLEFDAVEGFVLCDVGVEHIEILGKGTDLDFM